MKKRQADTAIAVYRSDIEPTLQKREQFVLEHLKQYYKSHREAPTAYELLQWMQVQNLRLRLDANSVRPRLTSLFEKGWVRHGDKRRCHVTNKPVLTWEPSVPQPPTKAEQQRLGL